VHHRETVFTTKLEHHYPRRGRTSETKTTKAAHWYIVLSDCALEFYEAHPPPMHFVLTMFNGGSHLPSDLNGMGFLYGLLFLTLALFLVPGFALAKQQYKRLGRVHVLVALLGVAYVLQTVSFFLELAHLNVFAKDGKGLQWRYTFFAADFLAEVCQGCAEFLVSSLCLFLACGWTTSSVGSVGSRLLHSLESGGVEASDAPSVAARDANKGARLAKGAKDLRDGVVAVVKTAMRFDEDNPEVKRRVASVTRALQQPARLVGVASSGSQSLKSAVASSFGSETTAKIDGGGFFLISFFAVTMWLEIQSRQYSDDFSAFHDHEHWPGYGLVLLRVCLLVLFLVGGRITISAAELRDPDAAKFLKKLRDVGGAWLAAFPALVATAWCAPPHVRHRYVTGGLAVLQSAALLGLAYLSLVSQRFLALSTVAPKQSARAGNVAGHKGLRAKLAVD